MLVRDVMTRNLITAKPDMPIVEARALMTRERIRHLLVTDGARLAGIVTDRDIRLNLPSPATSLSVWELNYLLARLTVGQLMTKNVITIEAWKDAREAARLLIEHKIGALPVMENDGLAGIVTETDLLHAFVRGEAAAGR